MSRFSIYNPQATHGKPLPNRDTWTISCPDLPISPSKGRRDIRGDLQTCESHSWKRRLVFIKPTLAIKKPRQFPMYTVLATGQPDPTRHTTLAYNAMSLLMTEFNGGPGTDLGSSYGVMLISTVIVGV